MSARRTSWSIRPADWILAVASLWLVMLALAVLSVAMGILVAVLREASAWHIAGALAFLVGSVLSAAAGLYLLSVPRWRWTLFLVATLALAAAAVTTAGAA